MRIPSQRTNDRPSNCANTRSQQHITDDPARACAEKAVAGLVGFFLGVRFMVMVMMFMGAVVMGLGVLLLLWGVGVLLLGWGVAVGLVGGSLLGVGVVLGVGLWLLLLLLVVT